MSKFFATNATDPPHWNLNSCFGVYCTIWTHSGPFGCLTKLDAKRAEVVQKFVPWSRVGIFHNKPLDPPHWTLTSCIVAFRTIWVNLVPFGCLTKLGAKRPKWCKSSCYEVVSEFFATNVGNPLNPKHMFHSVLYYFCAFGTVRLRYKTQCKTGHADEKVRATKSCRNFTQRTQPMHPIGL